MQYGFFTDEDFQQTTPFTDRVVCVIGYLGANANAVRKRILDFGATEVRTSVSRGVHYVIMGDDVPDSQLSALSDLNFHGYYPMVLHKAELNDIFSGHYTNYTTSPEIVKSLRLGIQHYNELKVELEPAFNSLYTKEVFVPAVTQMSQPMLCQQLGNMGIYANSYMDDATNLILLPDASLSRLKEGKTDDIILYIQDSYNTMRTQNFIFQLVSESEMTAWLKTFDF